MQDCQSHRVIEKRRRDRINSCLADLGRLVATDCTHGQGQGQARIKKTEIIEMAIQRIRQLQSDLLGFCVPFNIVDLHCHVSPKMSARFSSIT